MYDSLWEGIGDSEDETSGNDIIAPAFHDLPAEPVVEELPGHSVDDDGPPRPVDGPQRRRGRPTGYACRPATKAKASSTIAKSRLSCAQDDIRNLTTILKPSLQDAASKI